MTRVRDTKLSEGDHLDGRYTIRRLLGAGGFAEVYVAHQLHIDREVALKVLVPPPQSARDLQAQRERFIQDARLAARLEHPNVVTIYDFGVDPERGLAYIAMELLHGHDLEAELARSGPLEPARARRLMLDALDALAVGHRLGIVHKDLKPANLFLVRPGEPDEKVKLIDFGVARLREGNKLTGDGQFYGTAAYLAPEYIQHQTVSPALDVYQMGLILVELLTARPVVQAPLPLQAIFIHNSGELPIPPELQRGAFGALLRSALHKDPNARFPDAAALRDALAALPHDELPRLNAPAPDAYPVSPEAVTAAMTSPSTDAFAGEAHTAPWSERHSGPRVPTARIDAPAEPLPPAAPLTAVTPEPKPRADRFALPALGLLLLLVTATLSILRAEARQPLPEPAAAAVAPSAPAPRTAQEEPAPASAEAPGSAAPASTPASDAAPASAAPESAATPASAEPPASAEAEAQASATSRRATPRRGQDAPASRPAPPPSAPASSGSSVINIGTRL